MCLTCFSFGCLFSIRSSLNSLPSILKVINAALNKQDESGKRSMAIELENGEIDLEDSIEKYTKAMKLVKECDEQLKTIEENVNKIVKENGKIEDFNIEEE